MKEGTGGDPFADDPADSAETATPADTTDSDTTDTPDADRSQLSTETPSTASDNTDANDTQTTTSEQSDTQLPYYYRRETVKEGRDQVPFFLRKHVQDLEDDFIADLERRLNASNVYKADAREAALQVVYENHATEVADLLREWGYDR
ncbi:hypothetical protein [Halorussus ruber]|uniref:hypothetical protein n=1 Tax=Halorussus ruber TaxID=1126238 RepID=UPI001092C5D4|nr:hypothetical protein [Halorussus ruber]